MRALILLPLAATLAGCQTGGGQIAVLHTEIAAANQRIDTLEIDIQRNAGALAAHTETIRAEVRYRPIAAWAAAFSARPAAERTLTFQQTAAGGTLIEKAAPACFKGLLPGYSAAISQTSPANATVMVGGLTLTPGATGVLIDVPLQIGAQVSVEGKVQAPCFPAITLPAVTFSGATSPPAQFRLNLGGVNQGKLAYSVDLVAPQTMSVASRIDFGRFHFDLTLPVNNLARTLTQGQIALPYDNHGVIALPDGKSVPYTIAVRNPQLVTSADSIAVSADLTLTIGDGRPLSAQMAQPN